MNKFTNYIKSYQKPNFLFIFLTSFYFLNNSIFSINENISINLYLVIFFSLGGIDYKFSIHNIHFSKKIFLIFILLVFPSFLFIIFRYNVGISFRGDEIAHYSSSLSNLSYWIVPQNNYEGLTNFINQKNFAILEIANIKIINLFLLILTNLYFYFFFKNFFNLILFISSLIVIFFQNSFPYEYSQGSFFIDNITQIFFYIFSPFSFNETLGVTNFIFYIIYLLILRPLINNEKLKINDFKLFSFILVLPFFNLLLFSNYQEGIAVIFVLLSIEHFYKFGNFKNSSLLLSLAGCFREVFFLPIIIFFIFDILKNKKDLINNIKFYSIIFSPFIFHIFHISNNPYGLDKMNFINFYDAIILKNFDFNLNILRLFKLSIILIPIIISIYLFCKNKKQNIRFIILSFLNIPIILLLIYRSNFSFLDIDRFFYLWIVIFYFYIFIFISDYKFKKVILIPFFLLVLFNNFNFLKKYLNYDINYDKKTNLYLPIKSILKKTKNKNIELNIISDVEINKFNSNFYPNLKEVNFNKNFNLNQKCMCNIDEIYLYISNNSLYEENFCRIKETTCKKTILLSNSNFHILTFNK